MTDDQENLREAVLAAAKRAGRRSRSRNPHYQAPTEAFRESLKFNSACSEIVGRYEPRDPGGVFLDAVDDAQRARWVEKARAAHAFLDRVLAIEGAIMQSAKDLAQMLAADPLAVARAVLGDPSSTSRSEARWGRKGSLSLTLTGDRAGLWCSHESGDGGDLLDLVKHGLDMDTRAAIGWARDYLGGDAGRSTPDRPTPLRPVTNDADKVKAALSIWREAGRAGGTLAEAYLVKRGLALPADVDGRAVRFIDSTAFRDGDSVVRLPALVALMRDPVTGKPCGVQRAPLTPEAMKHPIGRRMRGKAGVVMVDDDADVTNGLHLVEGLEDALAARAFGFRPVWAAMSAGAIERFDVLAGIEALTLIADGDTAGVQAVQACAERWREAGREVHAKMVKGGDLAELASRIQDIA